MARRTFQFNKLIRNTILTDMQASGDKVSYRRLSDASYVTELKRKLTEEAAELETATTVDIIGELADIEEVIDCLLSATGKTRADLSRVQIAKRANKGSFDHRIYLETVAVAEDEPWIAHYLESPERYPEL